MHEYLFSFPNKKKRARCANHLEFSSVTEHIISDETIPLHSIDILPSVGYFVARWEKKKNIKHKVLLRAHQRNHRMKINKFQIDFNQWVTMWNAWTWYMCIHTPVCVTHFFYRGWFIFLCVIRTHDWVFFFFFFHSRSFHLTLLRIISMLDICVEQNFSETLATRGGKPENGMNSFYQKVQSLSISFACSSDEARK